MGRARDGVGDHVGVWGTALLPGRDAVGLARDCSIERVAALIWTGELPEESPGSFDPATNPPPSLPEPTVRALADTIPAGAFQAALPPAAAADPASYDLRPRAVAKTGARILNLLAGVASGAELVEAGVVEALRRAWSPGGPRDAWAGRLLNAALVLCADHELPVSTFAARCVASAGATPYGAVTAGLAAMQGVRHGGQVELAEVLLREVEAARDARGVLAGRLRRGERIPGFGHSLYPEGDPRGAELLRLVAEAAPESAAAELSRTVAEEAYNLVEGRPTVDLGLATVARSLDLPPGAAVALFALGRTVGWIGHAIEQYEGGALIRPRARYVGEQPG